jgi:RNA polymerase-binding transcription factor DksA
MATKRAASPAKKPASAKKAAAAKKAAPVKAAAKKAAPAKAAPAKKAASAKKAAPVKKAEPSGATTAKAGASKKAAPAKAAPKRTAPAKVGSTKTSIGPASGNGKPVTGKSPYDARFLGSQRALLLEERVTLSTQAEALRAEADALARDREPGDVQFDDESGEGDTLAVERDFDLARAAAALHTIEEIDAALERIDNGTYGVCEYSGQPIPKERLEAIPYARERVEFKTRSFR